MAELIVCMLADIENTNGQKRRNKDETMLRNNEMILMCVDFLCVFLISC